MPTMPTMRNTMPLLDRFANRLSEEIPRTERCGLGSNSPSSDSRDIEYWTPDLSGQSRQQSRTINACRCADGGSFLAVRPAIDHAIAWGVEISSSGDPTETYAWDIQDSVNRILGEQRPTDESEWEEYEEPLWDPMRAEVSSMVREFYEQYASAPSDHALQHNKGNAIPLESQADSSSSSENLDLTQTGHEVESEIRLVPPPTPEYRVKVKFRFTGEDTPRIHTDPDLT